MDPRFLIRLYHPIYASVFNHFLNAILYGGIFVSLFLIDYSLGRGLVETFQTIFCKVVCFIKKTIREEAKQLDQITGSENPISVPILFTEILILTLTIAFLKRYKDAIEKDRFHDLLNESKEALRQTNEFLDKWRTRRINWQVPGEYSYLDDEPQEIKPLELEVPILHMAIIDTRGSSRNPQERGDTGDAINMTQSTVLSVTSLIEGDFESIAEPVSEERLIEDISLLKNVEFENRCLWDVVEEDSTTMED